MGAKSLSYAHGFALLELVIASGIVAIVMMGFLTMIGVSQDQSANMRSKLGQLNLAQDIRTLASTAATCLSAWKAPKYAPDMAVKFDLGNGILIAANAAIAGYAVKVISLKFSNPQSAGSDALGNSLVLGDLILESGPNNASGVAYRPMPVAKVFLSVKPDNSIAACSSTANDIAPDTSTDCVYTGASTCHGIQSGPSQCTYKAGVMLAIGPLTGQLCVSGNWVQVALPSPAGVL